MIASPELPNAIANLTKPTRYLSCAETAKMIRQALKEAFPEIKFSVRSSMYAGGASVYVGWSDGPVQSQVDPIIKAFSGSGLDGMTDCKFSLRKTLNGEPVSFGADYVFSRRDASNDRIEALTALLEKAPLDMWLTLATRMGHASVMATLNHCDDAREFAKSLERNVPPTKFEGRRSALVDSVTYLGSDNA